MTQALIHEIIPVGMLQCNCSILGDPQTREALVIDPGDEVDQILALLARHQLQVRAIASTHTHIDHVGGLARLHQVTGAPVLIHESDMELYRNLARQAQWLGVPVPALTTIESFLRDGDTLRWGHFQARVLHTPGHTPGSISLWIPDTRPAGRAAAPASTPGAGATNTTAAAHPADLRTPEHKAPRLIAGDTLFAGSIGRTDLWGGSFPDIIRSIREKLLVLPEETLVIPGHGGSTTIGEERQSNPFLTARAT
jgi:hydroxyacylglutathione hydrolase